MTSLTDDQKWKTYKNQLIISEATFAFEIYDLEGKSRLDLFYLGDILRSLKLNPTLKMVEKFGGTEKKGEKFVNFDQFCKVQILPTLFCVKWSNKEPELIVIVEVVFSKVVVNSGLLYVIYKMV